MSKLNIKPLADRVLVEPLAVGSGTKDNPITVKVGQTVLYGKYSGTELKLDGNDYLIMRESDILAIV